MELELELERLERELELWLWSWSGWSAHEKVRSLLHFLACLLRVALQQALEPGSGACCALLCCALLCCGSGALLRVALLQLNPAMQQALERLLQQKKKKNPEPFAPSSIFFILLWFS